MALCVSMQELVRVCEGGIKGWPTVVPGDGTGAELERQSLLGGTLTSSLEPLVEAVPSYCRIETQEDQQPPRASLNLVAAHYALC